MDEQVKAFFDNFIENCEQSVRLDSVSTAYFCQWAKMLVDKEKKPLTDPDNIEIIKAKCNGKHNFEWDKISRPWEPKSYCTTCGIPDQQNY